MADDLSIPEKVSASFQQLKAAAVQLNTVSDQLGKAISELDDVLKRLNLGISTWVQVDGHDDEANGGYWRHELGYSKVRSMWGIALRTREGNDFSGEQWEYEEWLFNQAPRELRVKAVDKLPELLEKLIEAADSTAGKIKGKIEHAQQVVEAIKAPRPAGQRK